MHFCHSSDIWSEFPELSAGVLHVNGIHREVSVANHVAEFEAMAQARLADSAEGELLEIQAWRRAFSRMGLKPTQYRSASEALLRRFRKEGTLPRIHPLIDLCNAASLAFAVPIAVFDLARVAGHLEVRRAAGDEIYMTFAGEIEHPEPQEVIFADAEQRAHARRWTNRQSGHSAVRDETGSVLIVAEALHASAAADVERLTDALDAAIRATWSIEPRSAILSRSVPQFDC
ncbi:B3/B4 tRNA-binding domain protein [Sinorhizobium fredii NGR234]|uniref:B3/B4 tRNA-binding domain protein n=1 Tax=Sinorhizobium fredii (strain NBRC 101917 / NGR234) TaxID=394 RepID=C3MCW7_SINFN|nr:phenylalanine--tRNA ligase beta subunit-related protein [Sinorhizobium fredii]ACP27415.1 B3/B4 tRNA-binding domain protein [Sinorhizobium fredii NGR234]